MSKKPWILKLVSDLAPAIEDGTKCIDLRVETDRNRFLIDQMLEYERGDTLCLDMMRSGEWVKSVFADITQPTEQKPLGELTDDEVKQIAGSFMPNATRGHLIALMNTMYKGAKVGEGTTGYLAHFQLRDENS